MKRRLFILALLLSLLTGLAIAQWSLGGPGDWLSVGPIYHTGPYYYPHSDLPIGLQRFLADYPSYPSIYYPRYPPIYPPTYYSRYPTYFPYRYYFDSYPLGTFGLKAGGSFGY
jgi:hypothetical protein